MRTRRSLTIAPADDELDHQQEERQGNRRRRQGIRAQQTAGNKSAANSRLKRHTQQQGQSSARGHRAETWRSQARRRRRRARSGRCRGTTALGICTFFPLGLVASLSTAPGTRSSVSATAAFAIWETLPSTTLSLCPCFNPSRFSSCATSNRRCLRDAVRACETFSKSTCMQGSQEVVNATMIVTV